MALILARVIGGNTMKQTIRCHIPKLQYDVVLKMYFRENTELLAHEPQERSKPGDWVLIRELPEPLSLKVKHEFVRHIYTQGDMRCPLTGKKVVGFDFADDLEKDAAMFGWKPLTERAEAEHPAAPAASQTDTKSANN